jgi:hypothetical protein
MTPDELTQIVVAGQRTGIVGLKQVLEEVARNCAGKPDDEIKAELKAHLSQRNYIVPKLEDAYRAAFFREYKRYMGEPFEEECSDAILIKVLGTRLPELRAAGA